MAIKYPKLRTSPTQWRAQGAVYKAIKRGELVRMPCEVCGEEKTHGHHDDYSKPLEVRWLCGPHHMQWHRERGPGANLKDKGYKPKKRSLCRSDCMRCEFRDSHSSDWCAKFQEEPTGICTSFKNTAKARTRGRKSAPLGQSV